MNWRANMQDVNNELRINIDFVNICGYVNL